MSDFDDIMDLLGGPAVAPSGGEWWGHGVDLGPISAPTVTDTTSNADLWLPTSVALYYREYDRSGRAVDELEEQIRQQGLLTPIRISTDGEVAVVHEGNHRLQVADRLGIREVPVIVTLDSRVVSNGGRVTPLEPVLASWVDANRGSLRSFWGHRTALSDIVARGFKFDEVGFELAQKYMNGTMTGRDILQEIERKWGSVGVWWGSIGPTEDDFYGSASDAQDYAGWAEDGSIEHRWEDMLRLTGGEVDPSEWMDAEIRVVLVAKKPVRDYGMWNPTTENGEGSMWESTSYFEHGERLELVEIQYAADREGDIWKHEAVGGLTVTAANLPPGLRMENPKPNQVVAYDDDNPDPWLSRFGVGVLSWDADGVISWVAIQDDAYKRRGVATAMLEYARTIRPDIKHSDELSESGAGWAQAVGSRTAGVSPRLQQLLDECETSETVEHDYVLVENFKNLPEGVIDTHPQASFLKRLQVEAQDFERNEEDYNLVQTLIRINKGQVYGAGRTAANDLRVHLFDSEGHEMWLEPDFEGNPWTWHPKVMDAVRFLADVAQEDGVYWHMDHNEFIPSTITDFKVFDGPNDVTHEIKGFPQLRGYYASRKLAQERFLVELSGGYTGEAFYTGGENMLGTGPWAMEVFTPSGAPVATVYHEYDDLKKWAEKVVEHDQAVTAYRRACRTAAEEGGVLPWVPSQNGYYWITKSDGTLEAVTNDGVNRMYLSEKPWGWEWHVRDDIGIVERGNFGSGMASDALRDRADDLLAEFDTNPLRRTRGPDLGYQDDYTQAPNTLWSRREALHHDASNEGGVAVVLTFPMEWNEHLAAPAGTPPDQLHVTLGYFGGMEDQDPDSEDDLRAVCAVVSAMNPAFVATLGGIIRFSGEGQDAFVLSVDAPEIEQVRQDFLQELGRWEREPNNTHGFTPHATLGYLYQDEPLPFDRWVPIEVPVVNLELWYGTDRIVYPLGINAEKLSRKTTSQRYAERLRREGRR